MMTFKTVKEAKEYSRETHRTLCSCYINYPNPHCKKCVDYEPIDDYGYDKPKTKQYCLKKGAKK